MESKEERCRGQPGVWWNEKRIGNLDMYIHKSLGGGRGCMWVLERICVSVCICARIVACMEGVLCHMELGRVRKVEARERKNQETEKMEDNSLLAVRMSSRGRV